MIAGALVAQGAINDDEIGSRARRCDLARGCEAEQEAAAAGEQFFGDQNGEWRADGTADDAHRLAGQFEGIQLRVVTGPAFERLRSAFLSQPPHHVAIRIKDAGRWHRNVGQSFLPPRFAQQCRRAKHGR
jgi:hypothetical protein